MLVKYLTLGLVGLGCLIIILTPWGICWAAWSERNTRYDGINPIAVMVAVVLCIFEVALAVDWLAGR